jgi:phosphatidylserine/phosphatidylglycerophosphate/cardiolipin synthase-like enzyme
VNLIIQPEAGLTPVVHAIQRARKTVDVAIFRCDREEIEKALAAAVQRGVKVRVLVAHTNSAGENRLRKLEQRLLDAGVTVARTGDDFVRYHGKFMVADDVLHLFGFNLTKADTIKSRSFGISTKNKLAVTEALALFEADSTRQPFVPKRTHLVVSPENSRDQLTTFIKGAKQQLLIYDTNLQDPAFLKLLKQKTAAGVDVRVIGKCKGLDALSVRPLRTMRLHVRAVIRDGAHAFVGSQSLRRLELNQRREVGLLINNRSVAKRLRDVFEADWVESTTEKDVKLTKKTAKLLKKGDLPRAKKVALARRLAHASAGEVVAPVPGGRLRRRPRVA